MADEKPGLHIDSDWKKQAQEEKRRLAEESKKEAVSHAPASTAGSVLPPAARAARAEAREPRQPPKASFPAIIQSMMTQILFYLGELTSRGQEPVVNLDMAKYQIDLMGVLEEKTRGNLSPDEQRVVDAALYEVRMRFVSVSSQYIM